MVESNKIMCIAFDSTIAYNLCCTTSVSGSFRGAWLGTNPFYADEITLADSISFTGVNVAVSVPASAEFTVSGGTASWSDSVDDEWQIDHIFSNVSSTRYDLYVSQSTSATFQFGSSFYTPSASDGTFL